MRWVACGLIFLGALLSGCAGRSVPDADSNQPADMVRELPTTLATPVPTPPVLVGPTRGEPSIAIASDGSIYIVGIDKFYRSIDAGKTFQDSGLEGGGDTHVAVDANGRVYWFKLSPTWLITSDDRAETFSESHDISEGHASDRQWLAHGGGTTMYAAWGIGNQFRASLDGGDTWGNISLILGPRAGPLGGPIAAGPKPGQVYQLYVTNSEIFFVRSRNFGETWERKPLVTVANPSIAGYPTSLFPVIAADAGGTLYAVFSLPTDYDRRIPSDAAFSPTPRAIFLTRSKDEGSTWSRPEIISTPGRAAVMPWIAAGAEGRIAVAWYENRLGHGQCVPDEWHVKLFEAIRADRADRQSVTVQVTKTPNHVGPITHPGATCPMYDRRLLDFFAIGPDGQPVLAWGVDPNLVETPGTQNVDETQVHFATVAGTPLL